MLGRIADIGLARKGKSSYEWAAGHMGIIEKIVTRYERAAAGRLKTGILSAHHKRNICPSSSSKKVWSRNSNLLGKSVVSSG